MENDSDPHRKAFTSIFDFVANVGFTHVFNHTLGSCGIFMERV